MRRLLIRPGAIGDCILSLPALESLQTGETEVWVAEQNVPLIRFASSVRSIGSTGLDLLGLPDVTPSSTLIERLRSFDSIVSWYGAARAGFRDAVRELGLPFKFLPALPPAGSSAHAADYFLEQALAAGGRQVDAVPRIDCPRGSGGFAVIHPFSGSPSKNWPLDRFEAVRDRIGAAWCAGPGESLPGAVRVADLYDLACWLACAHLYAGNDSGITHLAAAVGTPVIALFGPTDSRVWAPRGPRVRIVSTARPGDPMERIPLEDVLTAVESMW